MQKQTCLSKKSLIILGLMMIASKAHSDDPAGMDTGDEGWDLGGETPPSTGSWGSGGDPGQWGSEGDQTGGDQAGGWGQGQGEGQWGLPPGKKFGKAKKIDDHCEVYEQQEQPEAGGGKWKKAWYKPQNKRCEQCKSGYYVDNDGKCCKLPTNCLQADPDGECVVCKSGYQPNSKGKCVKQVGAVPNCVKYSYKDKKGKALTKWVTGCVKTCIKCGYGFFLDKNNTCPKLPTGCSAADKNGKCTKCSSAYYLDKNCKCNKLPTGCSAADKTGKCTKCLDGWTLNSKTKKCEQKKAGWGGKSGKKGSWGGDQSGGDAWGGDTWGGDQSGGDPWASQDTQWGQGPNPMPQSDPNGFELGDQGGDDFRV